MLCYARLELEAREAEKVAEALRIDDPSWCTCKAEGDKIVIMIRARKLTSLLNAIDDYLIHLRMCEGICDYL